MACVLHGKASMERPVRVRQRCLRPTAKDSCAGKDFIVLDDVAWLGKGAGKLADIEAWPQRARARPR